MAEDVDVPEVTEEQKGLYEKRKKGAKMIDQAGRVERKRRSIDLGISDLALPPVTRKTVARYRMLGGDAIDVRNGQPIDPPSVVIPGSYVFYDPFVPDLSKREILMKNTSRPEIKRDPISGKQVIDDDLLEPIDFIRGIKTVDVEKQYRLYVFLELHPRNKSSKFCNKETIPLFERIDLNANRSVAFKLAQDELAYEAETAVVKMSKDELIGYATSNGVPTMENGKPRAITMIKSDLRVYARKNPIAFFSKANNQKAAIQMTVQDALDWGLIENNHSKRGFVYEVTDEPFYIYPVQDDPTNSLVTFLMSEEGKEHYETIKTLTEYWK